MHKKNVALIFILLLTNFLMAQKQNEKPAQDKRDKGFFHTEIPNHLYDIILGRPTNHSISVSIYSTEEFSGEIQYGRSEKKLNLKTTKIEFKKNNCSVVELNNLEPNQKYFYQLVYQQNNKQ
jgi:phenylacetate-coenzyme A ligase PaaK-like adenylate-forming protein